MMLRSVLVTTMLILSGCGPELSKLEAEPVLSRLSKPIDELAIALAGDDVADMRRAGRNVIATYDAGVGPR